MDWFVTLVDGLGWALVLYYLVAALGALALTLIAAATLLRRRRAGEDADEEAFANPFSPAVSIILTVQDIGPDTGERIRALLGLRYPRLEVVVVADGVPEADLAPIVERFGLNPRLWIGAGLKTSARVTGCWSGRGLTLVAATAKNDTDALNCGIATARHPLVCLTRIEAVLDGSALLTMVAPFLDDPGRVVAAASVPRALDGSKVVAGRVTEARAPERLEDRRGALALLRRGLINGVARSRLNATTDLPAELSVYRRELLSGLGGAGPDLALRIHGSLKGGDGYRIAIVPDPIVWVPLGRSAHVVRRRSVPGPISLVETPWRLLRILAPWANRLLFVYLGLAAVGGVLALTGHDGVNPAVVLLLLAFAGLVPMTVTAAGLALEVLAFRHYDRVREPVRLLAAVPLHGGVS
ncbi:hypothetical protein [Actinocorallia longicatena]|uniref:Cellulose synthase/poly-beta-1,6-N-acetylglucosamine synthase-like glycosyltransferase n=1 Tax=Actinocorallia longicatena TaxID=111803 RepID=A0ABP6QDU2_9ACTN